jgi:hypothetical protein
LVRTRTVVLRKRPVRSLAYSRQAGGRGRLHIREHPKRTSTIKLKHIVDRDLAVSIILVDPKMAGPYILAVSLRTARTSVGGGDSNGREI